MARTPEQISSFLDANAHRMDLAVQYLGTEPNAVRRDWDSATARWCLMASWPYEAAAGNQSIPAVYKSIHDHDDTFLCDRFYLPATPGDMKLLEKNNIPVFGIESKHQIADFDVVATSISYPVLSMSFIKMLTMSGIPPRWKDRNGSGTDGMGLDGPAQYPMVLVGGLSYGAPEVLSPIVDCWFLGEAEDEPGNPGIGEVTRRISAFKRLGRWSTDRVDCYADLAREFNFLYFPRFVKVNYHYEDRTHVGVGPHQSKQVVSYTSELDGMRMPFRKRHVRDLNAIPALTDPPLLYADPAMGSGDLEVARGCPAWCSFPLAGHEAFVTREGVRRLDQVVGQEFEVWTPDGWRKGTAEAHGPHAVQEILFRPADRGTRTGDWRASPRAKRRIKVRATPCHGWQLADGEMTHDLKVGDTVSAGAAETYDRGSLSGYIHGFLFGDGHQRHAATGERLPRGSGSFTVRLHGKKADMYESFDQMPTSDERNGWNRPDGITISSITQPGWAKGDWVVQGWSSFNLRSWPEEEADAAYLRGFLAGWMRADSTPRANFTSYVLSTQQHPDHGTVSPLAWLSLHAATAGWLLLGWSVDDRDTNFGPRSARLYLFTLARNVESRGWKVESITPLDGVEPVFCLTVPGVHRFTLSSGVTTGNCALSYRQKPYRQRTVEYVVDYAKQLQDNLGSTRMAPFSPDLPMHTQRRRLISELLEKVSDEVDAASMRVDDFTADNTFILLQVHGGMDSVTLGVEGNSQRMRDLVGKGTSDADIKEAVTRGIRSGIRKFKLYMISNLPGEDEGDVYRILKLAKDLADIRESMGQPTVRIQFSWTPLMIEANTPFQWFAPQPASRILGDVLEEFRDLKIDFKIGAKALPLDAPVLTPAGYRPMGELDVGDAIIDPHGQYSEITGVYPQGRKPVYKLTFSDGSTAEATGDHLWTIERWFTRKIDTGKQEGYRKIETVTTDRLRALLKQTCYPPSLIHANGLATVDFAEELPLPVDPYVLGLMLGDGCMTQSSPKYTTADPELANAIEVATGNKPVPTPGRPYDYTLSNGGHRGKPNTLKAALVELGIWGNRSWEKSVPERYKWASAKTRLAVLQGLMDTDGTAMAGHAASFTSTSKQLRDDVLFLARSLGLVSWSYPVRQGKIGRPYYQCRISETADVRVFRLERKLRALPRGKRRLIKSIELVRQAETQCITVSAPSKLFVTNDFIPTHNSEPNKSAFFQLCQRASREVGEALVDAMLEVNQACWGGVPRTFKELIESKLRLHGFDNGYADCFDERYKHDLFGWEFIDQGISNELLWSTYVQMREFVEQTDSHSYDLNFDSNYHGSEWLIRCDEKCYGKSCGTCDFTDLKIRNNYIRAAAHDVDIDLSTIKSVDQHSQAVRIRAKIHKAESLRFVGNDHWRFAFRRACFRAQTRLGLEHGIAKRSIRFASDEVKYRDWTTGTDYVEFAFTRPMTDVQIEAFVRNVDKFLEGRMTLNQWTHHPVDAVTIRSDVDITLFEIEVDAQLDVLQQRLIWWKDQNTIGMRLKVEGGYFAPNTEMVDAKSFVDDLWIKLDGHRLMVRMLVRGRPNPYNIIAALMGKQSWLPYAKHAATRVDVFIATDKTQNDFLRPNCHTCGLGIPINLMDQPYHPQFCPRCLDEKETD